MFLPCTHRGGAPVSFSTPLPGIFVRPVPGTQGARGGLSGHSWSHPGSSWTCETEKQVHFSGVSAFIVIKSLRPLSPTLPKIIFAVSSQTLSIFQLLPRYLPSSIPWKETKKSPAFTLASWKPKSEPNPQFFPKNGIYFFSLILFAVFMSDDSLAQVHSCVVSGDRDKKGVCDQRISKPKPLQGVGRHRVTGLCRPACRWVRTWNTKGTEGGKKPRSNSE